MTETPTTNDRLNDQRKSGNVCENPKIRPAMAASVHVDVPAFGGVSGIVGLRQLKGR